jgi:hypothetical protein
MLTTPNYHPNQSVPVNMRIPDMDFSQLLGDRMTLARPNQAQHNFYKSKHNIQVQKLSQFFSAQD